MEKNEQEDETAQRTYELMKSHGWDQGPRGVVWELDQMQCPLDDFDKHK